MNLPETSYRIAEMFASIQGEGAWVGTPMVFVRLAGCNVGKPALIAWLQDAAGKAEIGERELLAYKLCTDCFGKEFVCDTDYNVKAWLTVEAIVKQVKKLGGEGCRVCITGGEPFIHKLSPLVNTLISKEHPVHIETSGTRAIDVQNCWIACSPKAGFMSENLPLISEFKFLVRFPTEVYKADEWVKAYGVTVPVYVGLVNPIKEVNIDALAQLARALPPHLRLNTQLHKILEMK